MKTKPAYWAYCNGCRVKHPIHASPNDIGVMSKFGDFQNNHRNAWCSVGLMPQVHTYDGVFGGRWTDLIRKAWWKSSYQLIREAFAERQILAYAGNADIKEAFQSIQTLTITNFSGLATSATAGWQSAQIDNTSNLYLDSMMQFTNTAVNTAPANSKGIFFFAFGGNATGVLTDFGAAVTGTSEATLTFADVTANAVQGMVYVQPYPTQNKALVSMPFSMAMAFGGTLPSYWGVAAINHSGMTLGTVTMKYQGAYNTAI